MTRRETPSVGEWPVADLILPLPLTVAADVYWALGRIEKRGYHAFMKESDGMGRLWVRWPA
jgi:hypothetical protein